MPLYFISDRNIFINQAISLLLDIIVNITSKFRFPKQGGFEIHMNF